MCFREHHGCVVDLTPALFPLKDGQRFSIAVGLSSPSVKVFCNVSLIGLLFHETALLVSLRCVQASGFTPLSLKGLVRRQSL